MPATILLEDLQRANSDELNQHVNGLFGPPAAPGGDFDPSNIIPRQIPVEAPAAAPEPEPAPAPSPPPELQEHVASLFNAPSTTPPAPAPSPTPTPAPSGNVVQQLADHVTQATGLKWIGEGITNLQQGAQQATSGLTNLLAPAPAPTPAAPSTAPGPGAPPDVNAPQGPLVDYARQAATKAGIDPNVFVRQIQQESGFNPGARSPAGATGIAQFMPGTAQGMGIDPTDPYQALDGAARLMASHLKQYDGDYAKALAAYNAGPGNVAKYGGVPPFEETQRYVSTILGGSSGQTAPTPAQGIERAGAAIGGANRDISQFSDAQLTNSQAYAACGPAAAVRFAQRFGRNPTLKEAVDLASTVGWTEEQGMAGLSSEKALMDKMGVPTKMVSGADWGTFANEARTGNPVTISTRGHYFTADGWDPATNRFHVGRSGLDLKGGSEWMTPEQMTAVMGPVQGGLLADNPQAPSSTVQVAGVQSEPSAAPAARQGIQFLGDEGQTAAGFTAPGGPGRGFLEQAAGAVGEGFSRLGETVQGGLTILDNAIDSSAATANPTPAAVPGGGYDPSALRAGTTPPQEGVPLRQDVRDLGQQPQPTLLEPGGPVGEALGQIGELPGLSEADRAARRQTLEQVPDILRGPGIRSDEAVLEEARRRPDLMGRARDWVQLQQRVLGQPETEPTDQELADALRNFDIGMSVAMTKAVPGARVAGKAAGEAAEAVGEGIPRGFSYERLAELRNRSGELPGMPRAPATEPSVPDRVMAFLSSNMLLSPHSVFMNVATQGEQVARAPLIRALAGYPDEAIQGLRMLGASTEDALRGGGKVLLTGEQALQMGDTPAARIGLEAPGIRGSVAMDEFFRTIGGSQEMGMEAQRLLKENPGRAAADVLEENADRLREAATRGGATSVFGDGPRSGPGGKIAQWKNEFINSDDPKKQALGWALYAAVPFSRIPETIWNVGVKRLPAFNEVLGSGKMIDAARAGDARGVRLAAAETGLDTAINVGIIGQAMAGNITGQYDQEHPWSVRLPGDRWMDYRALGPIALRMGAIASVVEANRDESNKLKPNVLVEALDRTASMGMNQWFLSSMVGVLDQIKSGNVSGAGSKFLTQSGDRLLPAGALSNFIEQSTDPYMRDPTKELPGALWERQQSRIPGLAELLPAQVSTTTGEPERRPEQGPLDVMLGIESPLADPARKEIARLDRLGYSLAPPPEDTNSISIGGAEIPLTPDERRAYLGARGKFVASNTGFMNTREYQNYTDDEKARYWNNVISRSALSGRGAMMDQWGEKETERRRAAGQRTVGRLTPREPEP